MNPHDLPEFDAAAVASIIDAKPGTVRDLRDRGLSQYFGSKHDHFVEYSIREVAMIAVVRDLIKLGFPVRMAAQAAAALMEKTPPPNAIFRGGVEEIAQLAPTPEAGVLLHREVLSAPDVRSAVIELPIGRIWAETVAKCEAHRTTRAMLA